MAADEIAAVREPTLRDLGRKTAEVDADQVPTGLAWVAFRLVETSRVKLLQPRKMSDQDYRKFAHVLTVSLYQCWSSGRNEIQGSVVGKRKAK